VLSFGYFVWYHPDPGTPIPEGRAPISISPPGDVDINFHVDTSDGYRLAFYFATEGHPRDELIKIIGDGSSGINDKQGVKIPVSWELDSLPDGHCITKQEVISKNTSAGLEGYRERTIQFAIGLKQGDYKLKLHILKDVPKFSNFKAQVVLLHSNGFIDNSAGDALIRDFIVFFIDIVVLGILLSIISASDKKRKNS